MQKNSIQSNSEYRKYMIHNGNAIAKLNNENAKKMSYIETPFSKTKTKNAPHLFAACDTDFPYIESDLKTEYMQTLNKQCSAFSVVI